jgi:ABC-2 type transport system permease protein
VTFNNYTNSFSGIKAIFRREIKSYFFSATAFVYITLFLFSVSVFTFYVGNLIELGQANLTPFFSVHIYLYLLFLPALAMKLWAEERKVGTVEILLTLPVSTRSLVIGKFLASWVFMGISLIATMPIWISINILGTPDNTVIIFAYLGSFLVAGVFLAICGYISVHTDNQVIAFIAGSLLCFIFLITGFPIITDPLTHILPDYFINLISSFSALTHYENFIKGYFELNALIYMISIIIFWLFLTELRIDLLRIKGR